MSMDASKSPRPLASPLVCIVDDDISFREALEGWLGSLGYATRCFGSAEAFLDDTQTATLAHCLLLDVRMPGKSGLDLQADLVTAGVALPIVFITSHSGERHRDQAMAAGAAGFLSKPFDRDELLAIFDGILPSAAD